MNKAIIILVGIILIAVAILASIAFQPSPNRPNISVTFLGYTNDSSGVKLAKFAVTNLSSSAVYRQPYYSIWSEAPIKPSGVSGYQPRTPIPGTTILRAGSSETFEILPPTNLSNWNISVTIYPDFGATRMIKATGQMISHAVGSQMIPIKYFVFRSEWIANTNEL